MDENDFEETVDAEPQTKDKQKENRDLDAIAAKDEGEVNKEKLSVAVKSFASGKGEAKVHIDSADLDLLTSEFQITKEKATRVLRNKGGDLEAALQFLIDE
mmetsp:Transcript_61089/g.69943  ORF Transcript_61089/g.69943 Transcript_61089/m.69943 type:complete len:101 (+) Transcript_61089:53-355(+)|eukprot:CAMPEP_0115039412 /NCGR_PEP_ID=MMETSP0216-20121206/44012_1 /TAXON_ID=223996 /ORGANISM="Protocruzia adherens, Strain Boccale" /LENGTH=100 /DNA_ID=CAMNT_0002420045 /DNA_START=34 /DNA_END=336 /DNA_ORIENTATION=+